MAISYSDTYTEYYVWPPQGRYKGLQLRAPMTSRLISPYSPGAQAAAPVVCFPYLDQLRLDYGGETGWWFTSLF